MAGEREPAALALHRDRRCHASVEEISAALAGNWREEHVFALGQALDLYDIYQAKVTDCDARIEAVLGRFCQLSRQMVVGQQSLKCVAGPIGSIIALQMCLS